MIASLAMYDRPELTAANDALWAGLRRNLGYGPEALTRNGDLWDIWQSPDLLLAQTCGLPYRTRLQSHVQLVGTPDYGVENCPPGFYNSVIVARKSDDTALETYRNRTFAYNDPLSQSGWAAPQLHLSNRGLRFEKTWRSGSHANSARAVAEGRADIAALDGVSWRLIERFDDFAADLQVIDTTAPTPGLPLITAAGRDVQAISDATQSAIAGLDPDVRQQLGISGYVRIPAASYLAIETPPEP